MFKKYYQYFLDANAGKLHLASHSHHYWPDVSREAVLRCWDDSARLVDDKWEKWFTQDIPKAQSHISKLLNFDRSSDIAFGSNAHGFVNRIYSCLDSKKKKRILTTDSEFLSFERQLKRWCEDEDLEVDRIKVSTKKEYLTFQTQAENFLRKNHYDMIYISSGFYNTGLQLKSDWIEKLLPLVHQDTLIVIDGYHTFAACPFDLSKLSERAFFLAGGYKYAQAGEGLCFLTLPKDCELRPKDTGWFAHFEALEGAVSKVGYSEGGMKFWGSTQDMTALYRFNATWDLFEHEKISHAQIHGYIRSLQRKFLELLPQSLKSKLITSELDQIGHFFTIEFESAQSCSEYYLSLKKLGIITDFRANKLRFGIGMNLSISDIDELFQRLSKLN
jgi:selenocysteine lyase/cysteine desulfurase